MKEIRLECHYVDKNTTFVLSKTGKIVEICVNQDSSSELVAAYKAIDFAMKIMRSIGEEELLLHLLMSESMLTCPGFVETIKIYAQMNKIELKDDMLTTHHSTILTASETVNELSLIDEPGTYNSYIRDYIRKNSDM